MTDTRTSPASRTGVVALTLGAAQYRLLVYLALGLYWFALTASTHLPRVPQAVELTMHFDKVCHFCGFAGLAFLLSLAISAGQTGLGGFSWRHAAVVLLILATYGAVDERTQPWVGRSCEFADWLADLCGTIAGLAAFAGMRSMLTARNRRVAPAGTLPA